MSSIEFKLKASDAAGKKAEKKFHNKKKQRESVERCFHSFAPTLPIGISGFGALCRLYVNENGRQRRGERERWTIHDTNKQNKWKHAVGEIICAAQREKMQSVPSCVLFSSTKRASVQVYKRPACNMSLFNVSTMWIMAATSDDDDDFKISSFHAVDVLFSVPQISQNLTWDLSS